MWNSNVYDSMKIRERKGRKIDKGGYFGLNPIKVIFKRAKLVLNSFTVC